MWLHGMTIGVFQVKFALDKAYVRRVHGILFGIRKPAKSREGYHNLLWIRVWNIFKMAEFACVWITCFALPRGHKRLAWASWSLVAYFSPNPSIPTKFGNYSPNHLCLNIFVCVTIKLKTIFKTHMSSEAWTGLGSRFPACKYCINSLPEHIPLYGVCPSVKISHAVTPKAQTSDSLENSMDVRSSIAADLQGTVC